MNDLNLTICQKIYRCVFAKNKVVNIETNQTKNSTLQHINKKARK